MKYFSYLFISFFCLMAMSSCDDNGTTGNLKPFRGTKITIYVSHSGDTNDFVKNSEYYFDGDVAGFSKRQYWQMYGISNYQSILVQERSNVPLPLYKYGCLIQNIEYDNDSTLFATSNLEYDAEGFMSKGTIVFDELTNNKSGYAVYTRSGKNLSFLQYYENNILRSISQYFYDANGLCTYEIDSNIARSYVKKLYRRYNDKKQLVHLMRESEEHDAYITEYFYDNNGNNIKQLDYSIHNNDTSEVDVRDWVMYKGYRIEQDQIDRFIFDSNDNIIGYINPDFGKTRYKIEYLYY